MSRAGLQALTALTTLFLLEPSAVNAQSMRDRVWISVNAGAQVGADSLADRFEFDEFTEKASVDIDYDAGPAVAFDGGIGIQLWRALGVAVSVSRATRDGTAQIDASIPNPFFDNRPRAIAGDFGNVARTKTGVHAQVTYMTNPAGSLRAVFSAGPSFLNVEQEIVTGVRYSHAYPYDEAAFAGADARDAKDSALGFNVGVDVVWMFGRTLGVGGLLRYTGASLDLDVENRTIPIDAGGLLTAGGLRVRF